jgi:hypothetical protein
MINNKEGDLMTLAQKFVKEFEELSDDKKQEVIDFLEFLKQKNNKDIDGMMDRLIEDNKEAFEELAK